MRAAIYHGAGRPVTIEQVAEPTPGRDELLIEIGACGICGSDIAMTSGGAFDYPTGQCFGHEYAGTVVEIGYGVDRWRKRDLVACLPKTGCGQCEYCREGRPLFCAGGAELAFGFSEYAAVPSAAAIRLPQSLGLVDGALIEPMACGLRALRAAGLVPGQRVLVLGAGSMALAIVAWARILGAGSIIVASRSAHRRAICLAMGADAVHSFEEDDPGALGAAPHIVAECVGKPGMLNLALDHVRLGGTVIGMGMCQQTEPILPVRLAFKEVRLVFPLAYSVAEFEDTARAFDAGLLDPRIMVGETISLESLAATMAAMRAGDKMLKIQVDPRIKP